MESNPRAILALIRGCKSQPISEYLAGNLESVAKMLTNECTLKSGLTFEDIDKQCFVSDATIRTYLAVFRNAYLFATEQGDREKLVRMARKGNRSYFGVACLLDQKVVDHSRFESVKMLAQGQRKKISKAPPPEPKPIVPPPPLKAKPVSAYEEEIAKLKKDVKAEHDQVRELTRRLAASVKEQERLTKLNDYIKRNLTGLGEGKQLASQLSRFFAALGTNLLADKQVECLELANKVKDLVVQKLDLHLPSTTVWQGRKWAKVILTEDAKAEYVKLSKDFPELPRAFKHALLHLSLDFKHPSLRTYKKNVNPPRIPADAFTSRASDKFRFYWTAGMPTSGSSRDVELKIHKVDVKRG